MVLDRALNEIGRADHFIWRCVACGDIIDPVILINRTSRPRSHKKNYRRRIVSLPLTTLGEKADCIKGLESRPDDDLRKPETLRELISRQ